MQTERSFFIGGYLMPDNDEFKDLAASGDGYEEVEEDIIIEDE